MIRPRLRQARGPTWRSTAVIRCGWPGGASIIDMSRLLSAQTGLDGIRARVAALRGELSAEAIPGGQFRVVVRIPHATVAAVAGA